MKRKVGGKIIMPPRPIQYPFPKALGKGFTQGKVLGRAMKIEKIKKWGDYMRILDLVKFKKGRTELRFTQYYRRPGGNDSDWIYNQGAGHMLPRTFYLLIRKAQKRPNYGSFRGVFNKLKI